MKKISIDNKKRSYITCVFFFLAIIVIIIGVSLGQKQDNGFAEDFRMYQKAEDYKLRGNVSATAPIIRSLVDKYPNNYNLLWDYAQVMAIQGDFTTAAEYFEKTRLQHPFIVNDQDYLLQYSRVLINLKQYSQAEKYLNHARKITGDVRFLKKIDQALLTFKNNSTN